MILVDSIVIYFQIDVAERACCSPAALGEYSVLMCMRYDLHGRLQTFTAITWL